MARLIDQINYGISKCAFVHWTNNWRNNGAWGDQGWREGTVWELKYFEQTKNAYPR